MNNHFNIKRFGLLFKKHTIEHYKVYLMSWVVMMGAIILYTEFQVYSNLNRINDPSLFYLYHKSPVLSLTTQSEIFLLFLIFSGTIFTSTVFNSLSDKRTSIASLTLPASHFEKFIVGWIYSLIIFQLIFTVSYYVIMTVVLSIHKIPGHENLLFNIFTSPDKEYYYFLVYIFLNSMTLLGALFFEKLHFIKIAFTGFVIFMLVYIINNHFLKVLFDKPITEHTPFQSISFIDYDKYSHMNTYFYIWLPNEQMALLFIPLSAIILIFWTAAYFRLKEKQA